MITTRLLTGDAVAGALGDLARLRIAVFRDWPYLYDGDEGYEREYLRAYTAPGAVVVAAMDGDRMVGAATGAPMEDHAEDFAAAFADRPERLEDIFYCAESVLLPEYRGHGLGHPSSTGARRRPAASGGGIRPSARSSGRPTTLPGPRITDRSTASGASAATSPCRVSSPISTGATSGTPARRRNNCNSG